MDEIADVESVIGRFKYNDFDTTRTIQGLTSCESWELAVEGMVLSLSKHNVAIIRLSPGEHEVLLGLTKKWKDFSASLNEHEVATVPSCSKQPGRISTQFRQGATIDHDALKELRLAEVCHNDHPTVYISCR
jgi:hypothetical protein